MGVRSASDSILTASRRLSTSLRPSTTGARHATVRRLECRERGPDLGETYLAVYGSPRRNGNSLFLGTKAVAAMKAEGCTVEELFLHGMDIRPCRSCYACRTGKSQYCVQNDDMAPLYPKIADCSGLLIATPIYWFTVTAQLKVFMDRLFGLNTEKSRCMAGKKIGIILTYGDVDPYVSGAVNAIRTLADSFAYTKSRIVGIAYGTAGDIGDAEKDTRLVEKAVEIGKALARAS